MSDTKACSGLDDCIDDLTHQPGCPKYDAADYGPSEEDGFTVDELLDDIAEKAAWLLANGARNEDRDLAESVLAFRRQWLRSKGGES